MFYQLVKEHISNSHLEEYRRGDIIYHEGDKPDKIYFIDEGMGGLFHMSESGKETFFRVFSKDDILGHRSMLADESYHGSAVALTSLKLRVISKEQCDAICLQNPSLMKEMVKTLASDLGKAELRIAGLLDKSANKRIAESLVYLKLKYPDYVWTRKEIAEYSGSTLETVTRLMSKLQSDGIITKQGRDFEINKIESLLKFED